MNKESLNFRCCHDTDIAVPVPIETTMNGKDYVIFGQNNDMPQTYFDCYTDCSILQSVINAVCDYVSGAGINSDDIIVNRNGETLLDIVSKCVLDYIIFGAFTINVIRNKMGEIAEINWVDVRNCRLNEDGDKVYYAKNWGKYNRNIKVYDRFNTSVAFPNSIMYYKNAKSRSIYGNPMWGAGLRDVLTLIEASKLNYGDVLNHFTPNVMISFNNGTPSDDIQEEIENAIIQKFTGANGNNIMLTWSDDRDHAPELSSFETADYTTKYTTIMDASKRNILASFRISSQLVGITEDNYGFNDVEFTNAFTLFKKTVISPIQNEIERAFSMLGFDFKLNEFEVEFVNGGDVNVM